MTDMNSTSFLKNIATLGFIGYLPAAPGTWGSAVGLLFVLLTAPSLPVLLAIIALGIILGIIASNTAEKVIGEIDSGHIVIDEFVGFLISAVYIPHTYSYLFSAFLLFRFFDILKPFPVRQAEERIGGGAGIMMDDVLAGIYANVVLQVWIKTF
jgi:phosphatidylglycerophosphatase A